MDILLCNFTPIFQTSRFLEPILFSFGGSRKRDSTYSEIAGELEERKSQLLHPWHDFMFMAPILVCLSFNFPGSAIVMTFVRENHSGMKKIYTVYVKRSSNSLSRVNNGLTMHTLRRHKLNSGTRAMSLPWLQV